MLTLVGAAGLGGGGAGGGAEGGHSGGGLGISCRGYPMKGRKGKIS